MKTSHLLLFLFLSCFANAQEGKVVYKIQPDNPGSNSIVQDFSKRVSNNLYDSISVFSQVEKLLSELHQNGYIAAHAGYIEFVDSLAKVSIEAGAQYQWGELTVQGIDQDILRKRDLQINRESETTVRPERTLSALNKILRAYENNGYPFARISFENVSFEKNRIDAEIRVKPYNKIKIDSIVVRGDIRINRKFIYRQTGIFPGSVFNQKKIRNLDRMLNNLPYMTFAREPGVEFRPNGADLYLFLNRQKANRFQGMLGFLSDHKQSGKLVLTGDVQLALMNSFGRGEVLDFNWKKTDVNNQELDIAVRWPFLFGTPVGIEGDFHLFRFDTLYMNTNLRIAAQFNLGETGWLTGYYENKASSTIGDIGLFNLADVNSRLYGLGYGFASLDNTFNPRRGWTINSSMAIGKRSKSIADNQKQISNRFDVNLELGCFLPLAKSSTLLFLNRSGNISLFEEGRTVSLMDNELYRLGGIKSIRGFDENSILAGTYSGFTLEYRWLFDALSNIFVFTDMMYYVKNSGEDRVEDFPVGFGAGLNLQTKAGMFSISYALGTQQGNPVEFQSAKVHLGYISRF